MSGIDVVRMREYIETMWEESVLPSLEDFVRIPAQSPAFDSDWASRGELDAVIELFSSWLDSIDLDGMSYNVHQIEGRSPILIIDIAGSAPGDVLFYSHLDKQPPVTELWSEGKHPFEPVREDPYLFGRGSVDDGYGGYLCALAVKSLQEMGLPHPRCRFLIETCEESGSYDLPAYLDTYKDEIGSPNLIVVLDSGAGDYENIWVTESLRGLVGGTLRVEVSREGVHSGLSGGIIPETFRIARHLLSRIEDSSTGEVLLPELNTEIGSHLRDKAERIVSVLGETVWSAYPFLEGVEPQVLDPVEVVLNGNWRPSLAVTGADGFPPIAEAGNVLRPYSEFKLSMRLPPDVNAEIASQAMKEALEHNPPHGAKVTYIPDAVADGFHASTLPNSIDSALNKAAQHLYGADWMPLFEGGTIPFLSMMQNRFPAAGFLVTGSMGPDANAHGPDEKLHIPAAKNLTLAVAMSLTAAADEWLVQPSNHNQ